MNPELILHPIEFCLHLPLPRRCRLHGSGALVAGHALAELEVSVYPAGSSTVLVMLVATAWGKRGYFTHVFTPYIAYGYIWDKPKIGDLFGLSSYEFLCGMILQVG